MEEIGSQEPRRTRKTRFVCISDTHNASPKDGCFKLPPGDVLIHAGDLSNQGTLNELEQALDWIATADYEAKIVVAGNHDLTLDAPYYANNAERYHSRYPQNAGDCISLLRRHPSVIYLEHESRHIRLARPSGPRTEFRVFGSPYSPGTGQWAFGYEPKTGAAITTEFREHRQQTQQQQQQQGQQRPQQQPVPLPLPGDAVASAPLSAADDGPGLPSLPGTWLALPDDADVVVTHTPALGLRDAGRADRSCRHLRRALLDRVRPRLAVCGHVHEGWGAEVVAFGGDSGSDGAVTGKVVDLPRTGNGQAKIDLTARKGGRGYGAGGVDARIMCVVNAAIKARSRGQGGDGPLYNKPIVVDIDLPVWDPE